MWIQIGKHLPVRVATKEVKSCGWTLFPPTPLSSSLIKTLLPFLYHTQTHTKQRVCVFSSSPHPEKYRLQLNPELLCV